MIDEKKLIEDIGNMVKPLTTPDGCGIYDSEIRAYNEGLIDAMETVNEQPKVGGWIPCSERLPDARQDCLVTVKCTGFMGMHGYWIKTGHMESNNEWWGDCMCGEVIAWMPLPEPFKESED